VFGFSPAVGKRIQVHAEAFDTGYFSLERCGDEVEAELMMKKIWEPLRPMAADAYAERALRAVLHGDAIIVLQAKYRAAWYWARISPTLSLRATRGMLKRQREIESTAS
jgi:hypothetical protein